MTKEKNRRRRKGYHALLSIILSFLIISQCFMGNAVAYADPPAANGVSATWHFNFDIYNQTFEGSTIEDGEYYPDSSNVDYETSNDIGGEDIEFRASVAPGNLLWGYRDYVEYVPEVSNNMGLIAEYPQAGIFITSSTSLFDFTSFTVGFDANIGDITITGYDISGNQVHSVTIVEGTAPLNLINASISIPLTGFTGLNKIVISVAANRASGYYGQVLFNDFHFENIIPILSASNDAGLTSVLGQAITAGSEAGTLAAPKTASINVANGAATVAAGDIVKRDAGATVTFYGTDNTFSSPEAGSVGLTPGGATDIYIKVEAANGTTLYYKVTVNRAAATAFTVSETGTVTFNALMQGYTAEDTDGIKKLITLTKQGTGAITGLSVTMSGGASTKFLLGTVLPGALGEGTQSTSFYIRPQFGLVPGTYTETVTVTADDQSSQTFDVSFTVNASPTTFTVSETGTATFTALTQGYTAADTDGIKKSITLTKQGSGAITGLSVTMSGGASTKFLLGTVLPGVLGEGTQSTSFYIRPKLGLAPGTYTETVTITADGQSSHTFDVSFTVNVQPSSDAGLTGILGQSITAGGEAGTLAEPKTVSVNVDNAKAALGLSDIVAADNASARLYSDAGFTQEITGVSTIALTAGGATTAYIMVTAQNGTTVKYYAVTINRVALMNVSSVKVTSFNASQTPIPATIEAAMDDIGLNASAFTISNNTTPASAVTVNNVTYSAGKYVLSVSGMTFYDSYTLTITKTGYVTYTNSSFYGTLAAAGDLNLVNEPNMFSTFSRTLTSPGIVTMGNSTYAANDRLYSGSVYDAIDTNNGNPDNGTVIRLIGIFAKAPEGAKGVKTLRLDGQMLQVAEDSLIDSNPNYQETVASGKAANDNDYWKTIAFVPLYVQIASERQSDNSRILVDPADRFRIIEWYDNEECTGEPIQTTRLMVKVEYTGEPASSRAGLTSVLGKSITAGSEAGTLAAPKTASISVTNGVTTAAAGDIVKQDAGATVTFYGTDSTFSSPEAGSVSLAQGSATNVYIKVVAANGTALYYKVTVNRAAIGTEVTAHNSAELALYMAEANVSIINLLSGVTYQYNGGTVSRALTINGNGATITAGTGVVEDIIRSDGVIFYGLANFLNERTFLRVEGANGYLKLNQLTIQNGTEKNSTDTSNDGICAVINVKPGASVDMDGVTIKGFHNNPTPGNKNSFGVHAEPGAARTVIKNSNFDSSNAFRNAVAIRGGSFDIRSNTFEGTDYPLRLRQDDGYEYAIYIFGGTGAVRQNTITGYNSTNQPGYASGGISVIGFYSTDVVIEANSLSYNVSGIDVTRTWSNAGTNRNMKVNGKSLVSSEDAYEIGEILKEANAQDYVSVSLDQNDETMVTDAGGNDYLTVLGGYRSPLITVTGVAGNKATVQLPETDADIIAAANTVGFEVQTDGSTTWTSFAAVHFITATKAELTFEPGHTYRIRLKMTHKSYVEVSDPVERTLVTYSNPENCSILSNTATLSGILVSSGSLYPSFATGTTSYTLSVANTVSSITIRPSASNANAAITVNGTPVTSGQTTEAIGLSVGNNTITVRVTAQDGITIKTYTIVVTRASSVTNNPGDTNGGNSTEPIPPASDVEKITVDVKQGNTDSTISQITIERTTKKDGKKTDTVTYQKEKAEETVQKLKEEGKDTARIVIPETKDEVTETRVNIPSASIGTLSAGGVNLQIDTETAKIDISKDTLQNINPASEEDIYFRLVPIKEEEKKQEVTEHATFEAGIIGNYESTNISALGIPMTIETNMPSAEADITLPLAGISIPSDPAEREAFLGQLAVYIEHSDGDKELVRGEIVEYRPGVLGIRFHITKFSTFVIVKMEESSACDITKVISPSNAVIKGSNITATVPNEKSSITVKATVSDKAEWKLYLDKACTREAEGNKLKLKTGANTGYIKVTAEDKTTKVYKLTVTREKSPKADVTKEKSSKADITKVIIPEKAAVKGNIITATVAENKTSLTVKVTVSDKAEWKLYSDKDCKKEITDHKLNLKEGANTVYLKVTAENGTTSKVYALTITRKAAEYKTHIRLGAIGSKNYVGTVAKIFEQEYDSANVTVQKKGKYYVITMDFKNKTAAKNACEDMKRRSYIINYYFE